MRCAFELIGKPFGKARHRSGKYGAYNPASNREHEQAIRDAYLKVRGMMDPTDKPVRIVVIANFEIPKSAKRVRQPDKIQLGEVYTGKPDGDNILKSVKDALNGVAYIDDRQVFDERCVRLYHNVGKTIVVIETCDKEGNCEND